MFVCWNNLKKCFYRTFIFCLAFNWFFHIQDVTGSDWPMWRYDAGRTAASPVELPEQLYLQWVLQYPKRTMVWDDPLNHDLMPYDRVFEPIVMGKTMFIGFNDFDKITAIDTETRGEKWSFYVDGPVRLPPVAWNEKVYFTSDDGYLYCVSALNGKLIWKFRGGPSEQKVLGNKRFISMWPARGGPVLKDGTIYFTASIWPFMGIFIYALDAETGEVVWINDGTGARYMLQPHNSPSFAGVAPQGALAAAKNKLLIPGGRSVPACFDRNSGKFLYYKLVSSGKTGGSFVCTTNGIFFNHHREKVTTMYDLSDGEAIVKSIGKYPVLTEEIYYFSGNSIIAIDAKGIQKNPKELKESILWEVKVDASYDLIKAGNHLYASGKQGITAIDLIGRKEKPNVLWTKKIDGQIERLIAADDKLFAVTLDGRIMAFGAKKTTPTINKYQPVLTEISDQINQKARYVLDQTGVKEGYALLYGISSGDFLEALLRNSNLHITAVDSDLTTVEKMRHRFNMSEHYGKRIAVHHGDPFTFIVPPYVASLTIIDDLESAGYQCSKDFLKRVFHSMRPYGGKLWLNIEAEEKRGFLKMAEETKLDGLQDFSKGGITILSREGALPGSADWTHQYGNISNTTKSNDSLVKPPLGIAWFGGNSNLDVLPRHGHGPPEQVIGGRLFIEGMDCISARDVYTGRVIWKTKLDNLGNYDVYFDDTYKDAPTDPGGNQIHLPGANSRGTNFVATLDYVYVIQGGECLVLDSATGDVVKIISLPSENNGELLQWGYIGVYKDYLIAGSNFAAYSGLVSQDGIWKEYLSKLSPSRRVFANFDNSASKKLIVMNRHTGNILWHFNARHGFIHNAIAVGSDKIFCLDKIPPLIEERLERRGLSAPNTYSLKTFDIRTGKIIWESNEDIFGTWLSYSKEYDILLQACRPSIDMLRGEEGNRMITYKGLDGTVLWDKKEKYDTFPILHGDKIITEGKVSSLLTGEPLYRDSPLTGKKVPWNWQRQHGCDYVIASEHLITFRSAAAGYYDYTNDGGTGNLGGFRSGCTSNLIAADGVLNAPDYTRTCQCSYQNQTSLALIHMPEVEMWTFNIIDLDDTPIKRVGINFGAPGDHMANNGTLWLDYPSVGGPSPNIHISIIPEETEWFRHHSSRIEGEGLKWVAASGCKGMKNITIRLANKSEKERSYTVRLYFADPEDLQPNNRVFDISIQGKQVLKNLDIIKETGASYKTLVKEFKNILIKDNLNVEFNPSDILNNNVPIISGIEIFTEEIDKME